MLTFCRLGKSLQQDDAEAQCSGLIAGDIACDCCISTEAEMVLLVFPQGPGAVEPLPRLLFAPVLQGHGATCLGLSGQAAGQRPAAQLEGPERLLSRDPVPKGQRFGPGLALPGAEDLGPAIGCRRCPAPTLPRPAIGQRQEQEGDCCVSLEMGRVPHCCVSLQNHLGSFY